tara:strand:+ start:3557 stop:3778 length:222 start_codon:yes stop_codon:yes gene_type:complete
MSKGFGGFTNNNVDDSRDGKAKITIDQREVDKLMKEYKGIKKYMRSALFEVKKLDGTETYISSLIEEAKNIDL